MSEFEKVVSANESYASEFNLGGLPIPPSRKMAIVACMDARLDVYAMTGLNLGDAHVIRNAGGLVTDDTIRSLVISYQLLGTREFFIIEHTDCGMLTFQNEDLHAKLKDHPGFDAQGFDFLPFPDLHVNLKEQVEKVRNSPMIPKDIPVHGFIYHVETGKLEHVASA